MARKTYRKAPEGQEKLVYKELKELFLKYDAKSRVLKFPKLIKVDRKTGELVLKNYDGRKYDGIWKEKNGGSSMGLELSREAAAIVYDFSKVEINEVLSSKALSRVKKLQFNFQEWRELFDEEIKKFIDHNHIGAEQAKNAKSILNSPLSSKFIFNNGDFYPRNFISLGDRVVVIDWQTWENDYRANLIDYLDNVLAFCFIHMWGNPEWQLNYLREAQRYFNLTTINFQKALLIKSFEQARFWFGGDGNNGLCNAQLLIFKNALDRENVDYLLKYTRPNILYRF